MDLSSHRRGWRRGCCCHGCETRRPGATSQLHRSPSHTHGVMAEVDEKSPARCRSSLEGHERGGRPMDAELNFSFDRGEKEKEVA